MSYINEIVYDGKDVRAYADPDQYKTQLVKVADNASIGRYTAVSLNASTNVISAVTVTVPSGNPTGQTKSLTLTEDEPNSYVYHGSGEASYSYNGTATKFHNVESVYVIGGPYLKVNGITAKKQDFEDGKLTITYILEGRTFVSLSQCYVNISTEDYATDYVANGVDYSYTITKTEDNGKEVYTAVITVTASSNLATALDANQGIYIDYCLYQQDVRLTEGDHYTVTYTPAANTGYPNCTVTLINVSGTVRINYKQYTYNGKFAGIVINDIPATGPRDVGIYTGGTFKKEAIPNFGAYFSATSGFNFV